jgi:hypothetical protein
MLQCTTHRRYMGKGYRSHPELLNKGNMELTADNKTSHTTPFWENQWCGVQRLHWGLQTVCPVQLSEIVEQKSWQYTTVQEISPWNVRLLGWNANTSRRQWHSGWRAYVESSYSRLMGTNARRSRRHWQTLCQRCAKSQDSRLMHSNAKRWRRLMREGQWHSGWRGSADSSLSLHSPRNNIHWKQLLHQEKEVSPENVPSTLCRHTVIASTQGTPARCATSHSTKAAALRYAAHSAIGNSLAILIK